MPTFSRRIRKKSKEEETVPGFFKYGAESVDPVDFEDVCFMQGSGNSPFIRR